MEELEIWNVTRKRIKDVAVRLLNGDAVLVGVLCQQWKKNKNLGATRKFIRVRLGVASEYHLAWKFTLERMNSCLSW